MFENEIAKIIEELVFKSYRSIYYMDVVFDYFVASSIRQFYDDMNAAAIHQLTHSEALNNVPFHEYKKSLIKPIKPSSKCQLSNAKCRKNFGNVVKNRDNYKRIY